MKIVENTFHFCVQVFTVFVSWNKILFLYSGERAL